MPKGAHSKAARKRASLSESDFSASLRSPISCATTKAARRPFQPIRWLATSTSKMRPSLVRFRHGPDRSNTGRSSAKFRWSRGISSAGRMSTMRSSKNSSREYRYRVAAASLTSRKRNVSQSYTHMGSGLATKSRRNLASLSRCNVAALWLFTGCGPAVVWTGSSQGSAGRGKLTSFLSAHWGRSIGDLMDRPGGLSYAAWDGSSGERS